MGGAGGLADPADPGRGGRLAGAALKVTPPLRADPREAADAAGEPGRETMVVLAADKEGGSPTAGLGKQKALRLNGDGKDFAVGCDHGHGRGEGEGLNP